MEYLDTIHVAKKWVNSIKCTKTEKLNNFCIACGISNGQVIIVDITISQANSDENINMDIENERENDIENKKDQNKLIVKSEIILKLFEKKELSPPCILKWSPIIPFGCLVPQLSITKNGLFFIWDQKNGIFGINAHNYPINSLEWRLDGKVIYSSGGKGGVKSWKLKLNQNKLEIVEREILIIYDKNIPVLSFGLSPHSSIMLLIQRMGVENKEFPSEKIKTNGNFFYINKKKNFILPINYFLENRGYSCMDFFKSVKQNESFHQLILERANNLIEGYISQKESVVGLLLEAKLPIVEIKKIQTANLLFHSLKKVEIFENLITNKIEEIEIELVTCYIIYVFSNLISNLNLINKNDITESDKKSFLLMADYLTLQKKILSREIINRTIQVLNYFDNNDQVKILNDQQIIEKKQIQKLLPKREMLPIVEEPISFSSVFLESVPNEDLCFKRCIFSFKLVSDEDYLICPCCSKIVDQKYNFSFLGKIDKKNCFYCGNLFLKNFI
ncbi:general transcription factor 3c polypeptide 4 family [Anaeramoeba flamelloides]|uniref:General transcription factor 3c polypeptide 4 family n=1 Tax=Anaeramoeba flamelloides TaxID=1746091 RepID=A0ABQ8XPK1_9EUKA|nr:general transcription factor 3c polypeptide 4 family [Anaeramoeba flamelloides]